MIVCKQCGHHNEDNDTFCGSCGKFLEWTGERVVVAAPEPEPVAEPEPEPEPAHLGLIDRVKHAVGLEETAAQPASPASPDGALAAGGPPAPGSAAPMPPPPAAAPPPLVMRSVPLTSAAPPATPPASTATAPAPEPVLAGVAAAPPAAAGHADEPTSRRPSSVAPAVARPRATPRTMEAPTRRHPGDLICGQCGEGNDPTRHFCRRCGNSLDEALTVRLPWYRRFINRLFGVRTRQAGWRPRRVGPPNVVGGVMRIVRIAVAALLAVAILAFLLVPSFHHLVVDKVTAAVTAGRKLVHPNYVNVYPVSANATSQTAGHPASLTIDRTSDSYWAATASDRAPQLVLTFSQPQDLAEILFRSGAPGAQPSDFLSQPRPNAVHIIFTDAKGKLIKAIDIPLEDKEEAQHYPIDAKQVTTVRIQIQSVHPATGASRSAVAIAEVEFKIKD